MNIAPPVELNEELQCSTELNLKKQAGRHQRKGSTKRRTTTTTTSFSILIMGVTGRTGLSCLRRFARHESKPKLHAFCRDGTQLSQTDKDLCETIVEGDARDADDIKFALKETKATIVVVCIGNGGKNNGSSQVKEGEEEKKTRTTEDTQMIRTSCAEALVQVMEKRKFKHIRALVVSRAPIIHKDDGTAVVRHRRITTGIIRMGRLRPSNNNNNKNNNLRHIMQDHVGQETVFSTIKERTTIVRPTAVKDIPAKGTIQGFQDDDKPPPTAQIPRDDLASWIVNEVCCGIPIGGRVVNVTGVTKGLHR